MGYEHYNSNHPHQIYFMPTGSCLKAQGCATLATLSNLQRVDSPDVITPSISRFLKHLQNVFTYEDFTD